MMNHVFELRRPFLNAQQDRYAMHSKSDKARRWWWSERDKVRYQSESQPESE